MDRLEPELSRIRAQDPAATLQDCPSGRRPRRSGGGLPRCPQPTGASGQGRSNVRLDPGHHRSRSRWLGTRGRSGRSTASRTRLTRCVAPRRHAGRRGPRRDGQLDRGPGRDRSGRASDAGRCLASTGGRSATDPVGWCGSGRRTPRGRLSPDACAGRRRRSGLRSAGRVVERYSLTAGADWWAGDLKGSRGGTASALTTGELPRRDPARRARPPPYPPGARRAGDRPAGWTSRPARGHGPARRLSRAPARI